jgi:phenylpyruvate tautomerase PptA (4-oxalocrotonate tautomerase family)
MPLVQIELMKGRSGRFKKDLFEEVHKVLVEAIKIPDSDRNQKIVEFSPADMEVSSGGDRKTAVLIRITLFPGRSPEAKKALYRLMTDRLSEKFRFDRDHIIIVLDEAPMQNWGMKGGRMASEIDLGFNIKV